MQPAANLGEVRPARNSVAPSVSASRLLPPPDEVVGYSNTAGARSGWREVAWLGSLVSDSNYDLLSRDVNSSPAATRFSRREPEERATGGTHPGRERSSPGRSPGRALPQLPRQRCT